MEENALESALKQIQAWFVNGEFEKAKQGCEEVLTASPDNSIAQDLLQKANEALGNAGEEPTPEPPMPEPVAEPIPEPPPAPGPPPPPRPPLGFPPQKEISEPTEGGIPEDLLQPEPEAPLPEQIVQEPSPTDTAETPAAPEEEHHKSHSLIVNIAILVGLIVVGIALVYGYQAMSGGKDEAADVEETVIEEEMIEEEELVEDEIVEEEVTEEEEIFEEELVEEDNGDTQRMADLSQLGAALLNHYDEHKQYPSIDEVNTVLETLPVGPDGELYFYAVYDNDLGPNQVYLLSTELANGEVWSTGGNALEYTDFRDLEQDHVTVLHESMTEAEYLEAMAEAEETEEVVEDETEEEESDRERVPRVIQ